MIYQYLHLSTLFCKISTDFTKNCEIKFKIHFKVKSYHLIKFILRIIIYIYYCVKTHYRQPLTIPRPALSKIQIRAESATTIIHYSSFIIHYSLPPPHLYHQCTISIPLVISIHGNYFHRIYYFCISHNIP